MTKIMTNWNKKKCYLSAHNTYGDDVSSAVDIASNMDILVKK